MDLFPQYAYETVTQFNLSSKVKFVTDLDEIADNTLDLVVAADVMEHRDDPKRYATTFHSKLKTSGRLIISGPTESTLYKFGRILAGFAGKGDYHHTNIDRLESDIRGVGFSHLNVVYLPFRPLPSLFKIHEFSTV